MSSPRSPNDVPVRAHGRTPSRVLQVVEAANAGVGRHALDICEGLAAAGSEVHLVYSPRRMDQMFARRLRQLDAVECVAYPFRRELHPGDALAVLFLRRYLRRQGPFDLVHGHSSKGGALARLAALGSGPPAVYTPNAIRTLHPDLSPLSRMLIGSIERMLARVRGAVVAVSPEEHEHLLSLELDAAKVRFIPNGVPIVSLPDRRQAREALGLPERATIIGFVGRFSPQKAPLDLVRAFAAIAPELPRLRVAMIGWGELEPELTDFAREAGLADRIDLLGEQPGQASMPAFDLFALPSRYEGMPYVLLEALVAGLPIVTTEGSGASSVVEPGVNGLIVEQGRPDRLGAALKELAEDGELCLRFGRASQEKAGQFTLERMLSDTFDLYQSLHRGERPA